MLIFFFFRLTDLVWWVIIIMNLVLFYYLLMRYQVSTLDTCIHRGQSLDIYGVMRVCFDAAIFCRTPESKVIFVMLVHKQFIFHFYMDWQNNGRFYFLCYWICWLMTFLPPTQARIFLKLLPPLSIIKDNAIYPMILCLLLSNDDQPLVDSWCNACDCVIVAYIQDYMISPYQAYGHGTVEGTCNSSANLLGICHYTIGHYAARQGCPIYHAFIIMRTT